MSENFPIICLTLGDVAGIGPEVALKASLEENVRAACKPILTGHPEIIQEIASVLNLDIKVTEIDQPEQILDLNFQPNEVVCLNPLKNDDKDDALKSTKKQINPHAGEAAYQYLVSAIDFARDQKINAITTAPISKAALHLAGHDYPGHTEILAAKCSVPNFGMMLYLPPGERILSKNGLGVVHTTLHTSIKSVPGLLSQKAIEEKIELIHQFMQQVGCTHPRIGVCALNPHAGEDGLFGDEESQFIQPAVNSMKNSITVNGPLPADTLIKRATEGEFDGIVAMYHDQGHIAFKILGFHQAVNVTLGLPFIRTSPSHGTAFDIAWEQGGKADPRGMIEAILLAARLYKNSGSN